ncbi:Uncharacterized conserved protein, DUF924 family [Dyella sp. OK004]|uniref:DUF924 family protein n=1 Tax=Dyella sp. OK004 TaxID=1855292 RepID=UPI0008E6A5B2|nr:DUF924 family protein [Dyella sp. OK004]SFR92137.1 Uncharacterized conserved protein, DUF924 family [Dyella sp. OK004]
MPTAKDVLDFWFDPANEPRWFERDDAFDAEIRERFGALQGRASCGELDAWAETPEGWLALLILLDQFSRNLYRNDPRAFASDLHAQALAIAGITRGYDAALPPLWRAFAYLPLEHAEDPALQQHCVDLFGGLCAQVPDEARYANYLDYARRHQAVIDRFGRFPHRNAVLGRRSTQDEESYLAQPGAGF